MRGTDKVAFFRASGYGITPACAGNSICIGRNSGEGRDHPRVCGEQRIPPHQRQSDTGSPPRVRGTARTLLLAPKSWRITPACAGNSLLRCGSSAFARDHPRVCGEQRTKIFQRVIRAGSPPRVRGTGNTLVRPSGQGRITPACAGNRNEKV